MQRIAEGVKTIVSNLFPGSQDVNADAEARDIANDTAYSQSPPSSREIGGTSTNASNATEGRKRAHAGEGEQAGRKRMRTGRSENELRLFGDYEIPPDASMITVPGSRQDLASSRPQGGKMHGKPGSGNFKVVNSLNQQPHAARGRLQTANGTAPRKSGEQTFYPHRQSLNFANSRGSNVPRQREIHGDGFREENLQSSKRRKGNDHHPTSIAPSQEVDLTNEDSQPDIHFGPVLGLAKVNRDALSSPPSEGRTIISKVDEHIRIGPEKKKRKPKDTSHTTTPNHRRSPSPMVEVLRLPPPSRTRYDDDGEVQIVSSRSKPGTSHDLAGITNGVRNGRLGKRRRSSGEVEEISNETLRRNLIGTTELSKHDSPRGERGRPEVRNTIPQLDGTPEKDPKNPKPLRAEFVPLDTDQEPIRSRTPRPKQRASQRMQAASDMQERRESTSEDELAGESTVPSVASREVSPQKTHAGLNAIQKHSEKRANQRSRSPTDLKPTRFTSTGRSNVKTQSRSKKEQPSPPDNDARIPVIRLYCRSFCSEQPGIVLVWDSAGFQIEVNGEFQKVPGRAQLAIVGPAEASQRWTEVEDQECLAVHIKGSLTPNSNGNILIEFADPDGLSKCFGRLSQANRNGLTRYQCKLERMKGIASRQCEEIHLDHTNHAQHRAEVVSELDLMQQRRKQRQAAQRSDAEEIIYDPVDHSEARPTRQSQRMQAASSDDQSSSIRSKHFTYPGNTNSMAASLPRASTRATRTTKPKSPTPPPLVRWTKENKPERWSQSVIYPPEGAVRRVTVDFKDLERLDEGEFLNDNIIGFALRQIEESMRPEHKKMVLFFNSFFYTALSAKSGKKAFNYDAVKRWTKNKDVFSYEYIVVPINIDLHWFVMIICNLPNLSRKPPDLEDDVENEDEMLDAAQQGENEILDDLGLGPAGGDAATQDAQKSMHKLSLSDDDAKTITDKAGNLSEPTSSQVPASSRPSPASNRKSKKKAPPRQRTFDTETPTIMCLDSFGRGHPPEIRFLKDYVCAEAKEKRGMTVEPADLQGMTAKGIPEQPNFCDCGVYLVRYLEEFAKNPKQFVNKVLRKELDERIDFANFEPSEKRAEIRNELLRLQREQDPERKDTKSAKDSVGTADSATSKSGEASDSTAHPAYASDSKKEKALRRFIPPLDGPSDIPGHDETLQDEGQMPITTSSTFGADDDGLEQSVPQPVQAQRPDVAANGPAESSSSFPTFMTGQDVYNANGQEAPANVPDSGSAADLIGQLEEAASKAPSLPQRKDLGEETAVEIPDSQESRRSQPRTVR